MLDEIEHCCKLFETDYDNKELDEIKSRFCVYDFEPDIMYGKKRLSKKEEEEIIRKNIFVATEFYSRFVKRMRAMMETAKDYELISFMGP